MSVRVAVMVKTLFAVNDTPFGFCMAPAELTVFVRLNSCEAKEVTFTGFWECISNIDDARWKKEVLFPSEDSIEFLATDTVSDGIFNHAIAAVVSNDV